MFQRPDHILSRQTAGAAFGEDAVLIRAGRGRRTKTGRWIAGEVERSAISVSSEPPNRDSGVMRELEAAGVRLEAVRIFYLAMASASVVIPVSDGSAGDKIEHDGVVYRVRSVAFYARGYGVAVGVVEDR